MNTVPNLLPIDSARLRDHAEDGTALDFDSWAVEVLCCDGSTWYHPQLGALEQMTPLLTRVRERMIIDTNIWVHIIHKSDDEWRKEQALLRGSLADRHNNREFS